MGVRKKKRYQAIEPDEILIDAQNLPGFDASRLEGRIERPIEKSVYAFFLFFAFFIGIVFLFQLGKLQVFDAKELQRHAEANRLNQTIIIAERGKITDRNGEALALNEPDESAGFSRRYYPLAEAAAHLVGYVSYPKKDPNGYWFQESVEGKFGIEKIYEEKLLGENGVEIRETTATGETLSGSTVRKPISGSEIVLSLDAGLQKQLYDLIAKRAAEASFIGGSGAIIDVKTGELYALASYPSFDSNILANGEDAETISSYAVDSRSPYLDRAVSGLYTPGSVLKPFIALAALEENIISPEKEILSTGSISIPNPYNPSLFSVFKDWKPHGWTDMRESIAVSSDVYFYAIGGGYEDQVGLGINLIEKWMRFFGFGQLTNTILSGEAEGVIPTPEWKARTFNGEPWFLGNTYHTAIGQYGFQVTTLQLARATAALANGGVLVTPTIEKGKITDKKSLKLTEKNVQVIKEGMRLAVTEGTARALLMPDVAVAAKTGTAEVGIKKSFVNSLIVGFFPYENPKFAFALIMERAPEGNSGAPQVMRQLLDWVKENRPDMVNL